MQTIERAGPTSGSTTASTGSRRISAVARGEVGSLRKEMRDEIGGLRADFGALQRTLLQVGGGVIVALLGIIVTQL